MRKLFISYRTADRSIVVRLAKQLSAAGHTVWFDAWNLRIGDSIPESMNAGLKDAQYVIVCLSALGLAPWMSAEVWSTYSRQLSGQGVRLLPVRLQAGPIPALLADLKYADLASDWDAGMTELLQAIR